MKTKLNYGKQNEPAHNLFVVGNFMDLVRTEKGIEQVKQRIERFVSGQNPIVSGENRVHFISAQAALDAMLKGVEDEYLKSFQLFTQSLEIFLTLESGKVKIQQSVEQINRVIQKALNGLSQSEQTLEGKIQISEAQKLEILEKIGDASGCDIRIFNLVEEKRKPVIEQAKKSWDEWNQGLERRILEKSKQWSSTHSPVFSQDKLIKDYTNQFTNELMRDIDVWGNQILKEQILQKSLESLSAYITYELDKIEGEFHKLDQQIKTNFSKQINISITGLNADFMGFGGIGGGLGIGGALAAALIFFTGIGFIVITVAAVAAAIASSLGLGMLDIDGIHTKIKTTICQTGLKKFREQSQNKVYQTTQEIINTVFDNRFEAASKVIKEAISLYEILIEKQEKVHQETLEQRETEKVFIYQKRQELERVQNELEVIVNKSTNL
ncbi:hypothetical protein [Cylindrospermum sp. FACHB-282]|uniref:hypothetical protein n=1 Tax=Cylindrospermum sp. FACHB-282 TaxID=2692794 RepID=UPI00168994C2|nr:hypothetical protein [Cylindrospermum sp. FACHB-282]MBD2388538.1 hypothetical protein [Cylindrospermum sp. FACHB-282]